MIVGDTSFQVPFNTKHYHGNLYYKTNAVYKREAIEQFEEICRKIGVFPAKDVKYDFRPDRAELCVSGGFLDFAENEEEFEKKCELFDICIRDIQEIYSGFVIAEERDEK